MVNQALVQETYILKGFTDTKIKIILIIYI